MSGAANSVIWVRWTTALLILSALLFAAAIVAERGGEARAVAQISAPAAVTPGEGEAGHDEAAEHAEAAPMAAVQTEPPGHDETAEHGGELFLGIDLENPVLVWGFVVVSLLLAAVLRLGRPALVAAAVLAAVAAALDAREVLLQLVRSNGAVAGLASLTAIAHVAVVLVAIIAWRAVRQTSPTTARTS